MDTSESLKTELSMENGTNEELPENCNEWTMLTDEMFGKPPPKPKVKRNNKKSAVPKKVNILPIVRKHTTRKAANRKAANREAANREAATSEAATSEAANREAATKKAADSFITRRSPPQLSLSGTDTSEDDSSDTSSVFCHCNWSTDSSDSDCSTPPLNYHCSDCCTCFSVSSSSISDSGSSSYSSDSDLVYTD